MRRLLRLGGATYRPHCREPVQKYGAVPLRAAREAGVFHPNCTHRLEYLSPTEYPKGAWDEFADRVGEPGAFGDPLKTNAGLESKAAAKRRAEQAAKAAEERAKREAEEAARREQEEWEALRLALARGTDTLGKALGGSTGARLIEVNGKKYVLKGGASEEHLVSEQAADEAYRAAGIRVPPQRTLIAPDGRRYKVAEFIPGQSLQDWWDAADVPARKAMRAKLMEGADVDAMLGNWDVFGLNGDNVLIDKDGNPWRIDNGGSLGFRATGKIKADADWKDGWPNEFFTIVNSDNNRHYLGRAKGTATITLLRQAAKRDWQPIIDALPNQEDKVALTKRVAEMRQLAARAEDYVNGGYKDSFTFRVLRHSLELSKEGYREEVPKTITEKDQGFCRSPDTTANLVGGQPGEQFGNLALAAIKTVATHATDHAYNQTTLSDFYAKEAELQDVLKKDPNNAGAKHYLDVMAQVKDAVKNHTVLPKTDTSIKVYQPKQSKRPASPYTSLTDHIVQYMAAHGGDYQFISDWCESQAGDSWSGNGGMPTCRRKVVQLAARGLSWDPANPTPGVWYGDTPSDDFRLRLFKRAADFYKDKNNAKQLGKDLETVAQYKAAVQLLIENANFSGNDHATRTVKLFRTEGDGVVNPATKPGTKLNHAIGPTESFSVFKTVVVAGSDNGTIAAIPYSRINATYFMERIPGKPKKWLFLGDDENEFNVDAIGIERVATGKVWRGQSCAKFHKLL